MAQQIGLFLLALALVVHSPAAAQEKVIVGHSARAALSIGPLLYGIERGFYRDEGIEAVYVSLRADLASRRCSPAISTIVTASARSSAAPSSACPCAI